MQRDETAQPDVFATPDPPKERGNQLTDYVNSIESTEHRRLREYAFYLLVVKNGEG